MSDELDLEAVKAQLRALESSEDWAKGRVALTRSPTTPGNYGIWYDDGDLCAEVHDNLGLGMDGEAYADFFAASVVTIPALIAEVERLRTPQVGSWTWALEQMQAGKWIANYSLVQAECSIGLQGAVFQLRTRHNKLVRLNFDLTDFERTDWQIAEEQP